MTSFVFIRMTMALAFIPLPDLERAFDDLFNEIRNNFNNDMDDVLNYFEDTYIGRARRNGRDNPMFAQELWNMYSRTRNHLPRTNNNVEGWHSSIPYKRVPPKHLEVSQRFEEGRKPDKSESYSVFRRYSNSGEEEVCRLQCKNCKHCPTLSWNAITGLLKTYA